MLHIVAMLVASAPPIVPMSQETFHHRTLSNAAVQIYDVVLPPGAVMKYHAHPTNHLAIVIRPGPLRNEVIGRDPVDRPTGPPGTVVYVAAGPAHRQTNTGPTPIRFIAVELVANLERAEASTGREEAVLAPPSPGCHLILQKTDMKVTRCLVMRGESAKPVHPGAFLRIPIDTDSKPRWIKHDGAFVNGSSEAKVFIDVEL